MSLRVSRASMGTGAASTSQLATAAPSPACGPERLNDARPVPQADGGSGEATTRRGRRGLSAPTALEASLKPLVDPGCVATEWIRRSAVAVQDASSLNDEDDRTEDLIGMIRFAALPVEIVAMRRSIRLLCAGRAFRNYSNLMWLCVAALGLEPSRLLLPPAADRRVGGGFPSNARTARSLRERVGQRTRRREGLSSSILFGWNPTRRQ